MINKIAVAFLIGYGVFSIIHLIFAFLVNERLRKITKPFCMLFLTIAAIIALPNYPLIYIGAFLGLVGDVFLIRQDKNLCFFAGTISFALGHICYASQIIIYLSKSGIDVPWFFYVAVGVFLFAMVIGLYPFTKKLAGKAALIGNFYIPLLFVMLGLGIWTIVSVVPNYGGVMITLGYGLFIFSDLFLVLSKFKFHVYRKDFYIMLSYLSAQVLIVVGLLLIGAM